MKTRELKNRDSRSREQIVVALMKMRLKYRNHPALKPGLRGLVKATTTSLLLLSLALLSSRANGVDSFPIDGGGGTSSGGDYEVTGSIGQMEASPTMSGDNFEVAGGVVAMMVTVAAPDGTELTISVTDGNNVVVSWPSDGTGFILEQTTDLAAGNWTAVASTPVYNGMNNTVTLPLTTGNKFFRLHKP